MKRINEGECHWEKKREQPTEEKKKKRTEDSPLLKQHNTQKVLL